MSFVNLCSVLLSFVSAHTIQPTDIGTFGFTGTSIGNFFAGVLQAVCALFYNVCKWFLAVVDFLQYFIQKLIGLDYWLDDGPKSLDGATENDLLFSFLYNDTVQRVFRAMVAIFFLLLIVFTIFAIVKQEWEFATGGFEGKSGNSKVSIIRNSMKAIGLVIIFPIILMLGIISSNAILASLVNALNIDSKTFGSTLFSISAQSANRYRIYADNGLRSPVSQSITFYIRDGDGKLLEYSNGSLESNTYVEYFTDYIEYANAIYTGSTGAVTPYTVDTIFDFVNPRAEKSFDGFVAAIKFDGTTKYYTVKCDSSDRRGMYYYITRVLGAKVITSSESTNRANGLAGEEVDEIYKKIKKGKGFDNTASDGFIHDLDLSDIGNCALIDACYNTWSYPSVYMTSKSFSSSQNYGILSPATLSDFGLQASSAKMVYNSSLINGYFDGGQFGVVQKQSEYQVMADVVDFMNDNELKLYMMDATSPMIQWDYDGYAPDTKWYSADETTPAHPVPQLKSANGTTANTGDAIPDYLPFMVSYSDECADHDVGNVMYLAKEGAANELEGSIYIMCFKITVGSTSKYIPLVNGKTFEDPYKKKKVTFKSDYLAKNYKGVVIAKGIFETNSTNAMFGEPTYIKTSLEGANLNWTWDSADLFGIQDKNGHALTSAISSLNTEPYYYHMVNNGQLIQFIEGDSITGSNYTFNGFRDSTHGSILPVMDGATETDSFKLVEKGTDNKLNFTENIVRTLELKLVSGSTKYASFANQTQHLGDNVTGYLFCTTDGRYLVVSLDNKNGTIKVRGVDDGTYEINENGTKTGETIKGVTIAYDLYVQFDAGYTLNGISTNSAIRLMSLTPDTFEYVKTKGDLSTFQTIDPISIRIEKASTVYYEKTTTLKGNFNTKEETLVTFDESKLVFAAGSGAGASDIAATNFYKLYLFSYMTGAVGGSATTYDLYQYDFNADDGAGGSELLKDGSDNSISENVDELNKIVDKKNILDIIIDADFTWARNEDDAGLYHGKSYVAQIYKEKGKVFNIASVGDQSLKAVSNRILYDYKEYYNIATQNRHSSQDNLNTYYENIFDHVVIAFYRDNAASTMSTMVCIDYNISFFGGWRFKAVIGTIQDISNDVAGYFDLAGGITFDYFFDGDWNATTDGDVEFRTFFVPSKVGYWIILIASALIIKVLGTALWGVIKRFYEITLYFIAMPAVASTIPLDGGKRFGSSIQTPLISKVLSTYGVILGINVFFILLAPVEQISKTVFTAEDIATSGSYFLQHLPIPAWLLNKYVYILFVLVAFTMIDALPKTISSLIGADDVVAQGAQTKQAVQQSMKEAGDITSGRAAMGAVKNVGGLVAGAIPGSAVASKIGQGAGKIAGSFFNKGKGDGKGKGGNARDEGEGDPQDQEYQQDGRQEGESDGQQMENGEGDTGEAGDGEMARENSPLDPMEADPLDLDQAENVLEGAMDPDSVSLSEMGVEGFDAVDGAMDAAGNQFGDVMGDVVKSGAMDAAGDLSGVGKDAVGGLQNIGGLATNGMEMVNGAADVADGIGGATQMVGGAAELVGDATVAGAPVGMIIDGVASGVGAAIEIGADATKAAVEVGSEVVNTTIETTSQAVDSVVETTGQIIETVGEAGESLGKAVGSIGEGVEKAANGVMADSSDNSNIGLIEDEEGESFVASMQDIENAANEVAEEQAENDGEEKSGGFLSALKDKVTEGLETIASGIATGINAGADLVQGLIDKIGGGEGGEGGGDGVSLDIGSGDSGSGGGDGGSSVTLESSGSTDTGSGSAEKTPAENLAEKQEAKETADKETEEARNNFVDAKENWLETRDGFRDQTKLALGDKEVLEARDDMVDKANARYEAEDALKQAEANVATAEKEAYDTTAQVSDNTQFALQNEDVLAARDDMVAKAELRHSTAADYANAQEATKNAEAELNAAKESGDEAAINEAQAKFEQAQQHEGEVKERSEAAYNDHKQSIDNYFNKRNSFLDGAKERGEIDNHVSLDKYDEVVNNANQARANRDAAQENRDNAITAHQEAIDTYFDKRTSFLEGAKERGEIDRVITNEEYQDAADNLRSATGNYAQKVAASNIANDNLIEAQMLAKGVDKGTVDNLMSSQRENTMQVNASNGARVWSTSKEIDEQLKNDLAGGVPGSTENAYVMNGLTPTQQQALQSLSPADIQHIVDLVLAQLSGGSAPLGGDDSLSGGMGGVNFVSGSGDGPIIGSTFVARNPEALQEAETNLADMTQLHAEAAADKENALVELNTAEATFAEKDQEVTAQEAVLAENESSYQEAVGAREQAETEHSEVEAKYNQESQDYETMEAEYKDLEGQRDTASENVSKTRRDVSEAKSELRQSESELRTATRESSAADREYANAQGDTAKKQAAFDTINAEYEQKKGTYDEIHARHEDLKEDVDKQEVAKTVANREWSAASIALENKDKEIGAVDSYLLENNVEHERLVGQKKKAEDRMTANNAQIASNTSEIESIDAENQALMLHESRVYNAHNRLKADQVVQERTYSNAQNATNLAQEEFDAASSDYATKHSASKLFSKLAGNLTSQLDYDGKANETPEEKAKREQKNQEIEAKLANFKFDGQKVNGVDVGEFLKSQGYSETEIANGINLEALAHKTKDVAEAAGKVKDEKKGTLDQKRSDEKDAKETLKETNKQLKLNEGEQHRIRDQFSENYSRKRSLTEQNDALTSENEFIPAEIAAVERELAKNETEAANATAKRENLSKEREGLALDEQQKRDKRDSTAEVYDVLVQQKDNLESDEKKALKDFSAVSSKKETAEARLIDAKTTEGLAKTKAETKKQTKETAEKSVEKAKTKVETAENTHNKAVETLDGIKGDMKDKKQEMKDKLKEHAQTGKVLEEKAENLSDARENELAAKDKVNAQKEVVNGAVAAREEAAQDVKDKQDQFVDASRIEGEFRKAKDDAQAAYDAEKADVVEVPVRGQGQGAGGQFDGSMNDIDNVADGAGNGRFAGSMNDIDAVANQGQGGGAARRPNNTPFDRSLNDIDAVADASGDVITPDGEQNNDKKSKIAKTIFNAIGTAGTVIGTIAGGPIVGLLIHKTAKNVKKMAPGIVQKFKDKHGEFKKADGWGKAAMITKAAMTGAGVLAGGVLAAQALTFAAPALGVLGAMTASVGVPLWAIGAVGLTGIASKKMAQARDNGTSYVNENKPRVVKAGAGTEVASQFTQVGADGKAVSVAAPKATDAEKQARASLKKHKSVARAKSTARRQAKVDLNVADGQVEEAQKAYDEVMNDANASEQDKQEVTKALAEAKEYQSEKQQAFKLAQAEETTAKGLVTKDKQAIESSMTPERKAARREQIAGTLIGGLGAVGTVAGTIAGGPILGLIIHKAAKNVKKAAPNVMRSVSQKYGEFKKADGWGKAEILSGMVMKGAAGVAGGVLAAQAITFAAPALAAINAVTSPVGAPLWALGALGVSGVIKKKANGPYRVSGTRGATFSSANTGDMVGVRGSSARSTGAYIRQAVSGTRLSEEQINEVAKNEFNASAINDTDYVDNKANAKANVVRNRVNSRIGRLVTAEVLTSYGESLGATGSASNKKQAAVKNLFTKSMRRTAIISTLSDTEKAELEGLTVQDQDERLKGYKVSSNVDGRGQISFAVQKGNKTSVVDKNTTDSLVSKMLSSNNIGDEKINTAIDKVGASTNVEKALAGNLALGVDYNTQNSSNTTSMTALSVYREAGKDEDIYNEAVLRHIEGSGKDSALYQRFADEFNISEDTNLKSPETRTRVLEQIGRFNKMDNNNVINSLDSSSVAKEFSEVVREKAVSGEFKVTSWELADKETKSNFTSKISANLNNISRNSILNGAGSSTQNQIIANTATNMMRVYGNEDPATRDIQNTAFANRLSDADINRIAEVVLRALTGKTDASELNGNDRALLGFTHTLNGGSFDGVNVQNSPNFISGFHDDATRMQAFETLSDSEIAGAVEENGRTELYAQVATQDPSMALSRDQLAMHQANYFAFMENGESKSAVKKLYYGYARRRNIDTNINNANEQQLRSFFKTSNKASSLVTESMKEAGYDFAAVANPNYNERYNRTDAEEALEHDMSTEAIASDPKALYHAFVNSSVDNKENITNAMFAEYAGIADKSAGGYIATKTSMTGFDWNGANAKGYSNDDLIMAYNKAKLLSGKAPGKVSIDDLTPYLETNEDTDTKVLQTMESMSNADHSKLFNSGKRFDEVVGSLGGRLTSEQKTELVDAAASSGFVGLSKAEQDATIVGMARKDSSIMDSVKTARDGQIPEMSKGMAGFYNKVADLGSLNSEKLTKLARNIKSGTPMGGVKLSEGEQGDALAFITSIKDVNAKNAHKMTGMEAVQSLLSNGEIAAAGLGGKNEITDADILAYLASNAGKKDNQRLVSNASDMTYFEMKERQKGSTSKDVYESIKSKNTENTSIDNTIETQGNLIDTSSLRDHIEKTNQTDAINYVADAYSNGVRLLNNDEREEIEAKAAYDVIGASTIKKITSSKDYASNLANAQNEALLDEFNSNALFSSNVKKIRATKKFEESKTSENFSESAYIVAEVEKESAGNEEKKGFISRFKDNVERKFVISEATKDDAALKYDVDDASAKAVDREVRTRLALGMGSRIDSYADDIRSKSSIYRKASDAYRAKYGSGLDSDATSDKTRNNYLASEDFMRNLTPVEQEEVVRSRRRIDLSYATVITKDEAKAKDLVDKSAVSGKSIDTALIDGGYFTGAKQLRSLSDNALNQKVFARVEAGDFEKIYKDAKRDNGGKDIPEFAKAKRDFIKNSTPQNITPIVNEDAVSSAERDSFNSKRNIIRQVIRNDDKSEILTNTFRNSTLVNEEKILGDLINSISDAKRRSSLYTTYNRASGNHKKLNEIKQNLSNEEISKYISSNETVKDHLVDVAATNPVLALDKKTQVTRKVETVLNTRSLHATVGNELFAQEFKGNKVEERKVVIESVKDKNSANFNAEIAKLLNSSVLADKLKGEKVVDNNFAMLKKNVVQERYFTKNEAGKYQINKANTNEVAFENAIKTAEKKEKFEKSLNAQMTQVFNAKKIISESDKASFFKNDATFKGASTQTTEFPKGPAGVKQAFDNFVQVGSVNSVAAKQTGVVFKQTKQMPETSPAYANWNRYIDSRIAQINNGVGNREARAAEVAKLKTMKIDMKLPAGYANMTRAQKNAYDKAQDANKARAIDAGNFNALYNNARVSSSNNASRQSFAKNHATYQNGAYAMNVLSKADKQSERVRTAHEAERIRTVENIKRYNDTKPMRNNNFEFGSNFASFARSYFSNRTAGAIDRSATTQFLNKYRGQTDRNGNKIGNNFKFSDLTAKQQTELRTIRTTVFEKKLETERRVATAKVNNDRVEYIYRQSMPTTIQSMQPVRYVNATPKYVERQSVINPRVVARPMVGGPMMEQRPGPLHYHRPMHRRLPPDAIRRRILEQRKLIQMIDEFNRNFKGSSADYERKLKAKADIQVKEVYNKYKRKLQKDISAITKKAKNELNNVSGGSELTSPVPAKDMSNNVNRLNKKEEARIREIARQEIRKNRPR